MLHQSLSGIRVLDLTRLYPGPLCTLMLADLGAEITKVESPGGELGRYFPPYQYGSSALFLQLNRGKRSLTLNLKKPKGAEILHRLLEQCDVLVESFRPGIMRRFGLDFESLKDRYPALVYCSISGYGQQSPYERNPGHDLNYISLAGLLSLDGDAEHGVLIPPIQVADTMGAFQAGMAVCAALVQRGRTGRGQHIDISLLDGALFTMIHLASLHFAGVPLRPGQLPLSGRLAGYNVYRTRDNRYLALGFLEPKFWESFCLKMNLDQFANSQIQGDQSNLIRVLAERIAARTLNEWMEFFQGENLCVTPVREFREVLADPHVRERSLFETVTYPSGDLLQMKTPFVPEAAKGRAPLLGEHNVEILREHGYSAAEIDAFKEEGVL
jgi:crotonobetainyl-CoA:carnitine CoA-transferase CaiB-like acyl-CoA transferase